MSKSHWDSVYGRKAADAVNWYAPHLAESPGYIQRSDVGKAASIIDVGGGESTLVDDLSQCRLHGVTVVNRCGALWADLHHPERSQFSVAEMLEHELPQLMPMPEPFDGYVKTPARVSSTCLVSVARNRYSVPCELAGHIVSARLNPSRVVIVADDQVMAEHEWLTSEEL
ncbi:hypothetical protein EV672_11262 [Aquabacterium commune]|uniref:Transposase for insertion sequence element IS21-like C-terminal domain-containing protein n=1 Tax=Aquabacterium commune TaxID=70586 RepID=A0A4R6R1M0_9BURK|nr:hypothetical protein EV672_11262 [Aquabacterium commune]